MVKYPTKIFTILKFLQNPKHTMNSVKHKEFEQLYVAVCLEVKTMYTISKTTKKNVERVTGLTMDKIRTMTPLEEKEWIEKEQNKKTIFSRRIHPGIVGRGNPLLSRRKIRTFADLEKISRRTIGI